MKLLIVDDDVFLRDMYALKFSESDYEVQAAETAEHALQIIEQTPDLKAVLIDMIMPGMTGIELIREIKERHQSCEAALIILSNQGQESDIAEATEAGASGYIIKAEAIPSDVVKQVTKILTKDSD